MESAMGAKDTVRALLDRLPDDCTIEEVIAELYRLEDLGPEEVALPQLTQAQRDEIDRRLAEFEREPESVVPWREFLRRLERGR
jgi:putative addiction module component (TIGR02574 family)